VTPRKSRPTNTAEDLRAPGTRVTLKDVAAHLKLSPTTVSLVMNDAPSAASIPLQTKERVFSAARLLGYRPNHLARSLRRQRSSTIGVLVQEISEGYAAGVMSGVESRLMQSGYVYLVASHHGQADLIDEYLALLSARLVEGFILVNTPLRTAPPAPTVVVSGHERIPGVTNVVIDHDRATLLALSHLADLGHERIAFFKGHAKSADTDERWRAIRGAARALGLRVRPELTLQLEGEPTGGVFSPEQGYEEGYSFGRRLLDRSADFTALFAFNDISAIGAMRAFREARLRVPEDVSVIGFDDIQSAAFQNPRLTTVRQPLGQMGDLAARTLLGRLSGLDGSPDTLTVEPELIVRESTAAARVRRAARPGSERRTALPGGR
jgi:LacI family transcriptional regulator